MHPTALPLSQARPASRRRWAARLTFLYLGYTLLGWLSLRLSIPPDYAAPLFPAAGLALTGMLCWGRRAAPAVFLGSLTINLLLSHERGQTAWLTPLAIALGATAQSWVGTNLVRRHVSRPLLLSEPRDLGRFYLFGAGLACLISPSIAVTALRLAGTIPAEGALGTWTSWWMGDTLGVLIGAPIALSLLARPREVWWPRRLTVGLPMLLATLMMAYATSLVLDWNYQQARHSFERDAERAAASFEAALRLPLMDVEAARALLSVNPQLGRQDFRRALGNRIGEAGPLQSLGWAQLVSRQQLPGFDQQAQADGLPGFIAHDRQRPGDHRSMPEEAMLAVRLVEPQLRNGAVLGINLRSIPAARAALALAESTGQPAATPALTLAGEGPDAMAVLLFQAVYRGEPVNRDERLAALQGVAFAAIRPEQLLRAQANSLPGHLRLCLIDNDPQAAQRRLAGNRGCESLPDAMPVKSKMISVGARQWQIDVYPASGGLQGQAGNSLPFALVGLASTALLGALLLIITGRAQRIATLVAERTAQLKSEVEQREQASLALKDREQRLRNVLDNAPIGVVFTDLQDHALGANPYFCRLLGYDADTLLKQRMLDLTHPDDRAEDERLMAALISGEIPMYQRLKRYIGRHGQIVRARALVTVLRDAQGQVYNLVGVVEDIAERLKLQELEQAREHAEAASQAKNEFLSRMSHELRTPLNAMLGFAQLLELDREPPLSQRQEGWAAQIQLAGWHLLDMINDTLDLSRIESGDLRLELQPLHVPTMLDEVQALVESDAAVRGISFARVLAPQGLWMRGDPTRVKQVLINLLSNAIKYNLEDGRVELGSRLDENGMLELTVTDTGMGMSPEQLAQLFQPFNRLGREHSEIEGTGIGLVISKRLAEAMGGSLSAESEFGQGSSFVLRLPLAEAPEPGQRPAAPPAPLPVAALQKRRLIYVEDNATNAEVMRGMLSQRSDLQMELCVDMQSGLERILEAQPDLVLLDLQLPDGDGLSLLRELRAAGASMPIIMVSANAVAEQIEACLAAGAQHYLTKPVELRELLHLLDELLPAHPQ
ncbi:CHASE domain-containing protein [Paucibacter sp. APW11]|uniref:histidine kinase n=1 Tax=Roseateles aquae TaxID=3077235 RepID=A0ABU3PGF4_9BURK|nr:CHASE domain-containing protein [Paucibacter sp. APW11]MDT9001222.1 CHASE domain-containing protein [Paucibacter sp. APW11]